MPQITQEEADAAIKRVQLGTSTLEDGNLLRAWFDQRRHELEQAVAGSDEPSAFERALPCESVE